MYLCGFFGFWEFGARSFGSNLLKWHSLRTFFLTLLRPRLPLFFSLLFLAFPPHFVGLECCCFWFCFRNTTTLSFFSHLPVFGFLLVFLLSGCAFRRQTVKGAQRHGLKQAKPKTSGEGSMGRKQGAGGRTAENNTQKTCAIPHCGVAHRKTKLGRQEGKEGVLRGSKEKRNQNRNKGTKTQTLNIPRETRRVLPGVVLGGPSYIGSPFNSFHQAC